MNAVSPAVREAVVDVTRRLKTGPESVGIAADRLRSIVNRLCSLVNRIENLDAERMTLGSDITDIFEEAESAGFDVKVLRRLIQTRKQDAAGVEERETMLDLYRKAIGD